LLSQDEARLPLVPTLCTTLGVKGHRPVVGTWDNKDLVSSFAALNVVTGQLTPRLLESPAKASRGTGYAKTRRLQQACGAPLHNFARHVCPHPRIDQTRVYDLFCGSWIDELGSAPGVDLGTWIGEPEENRGWQVLGQTREFLAKTRLTSASAPQVFAALYAAEGSDWFWWFGNDQDSGADADFDDYFRMHLKSIYRLLKQPYPEVLDRHIVPRTVVWSFTRPVREISAKDSLTIRTNCPGMLRWWTKADPTWRILPLKPRGGVMAGQRAYSITLGPFLPKVAEVLFTFSCDGCRCDRTALCCRGEE
jgi:hypothetical protein